MKRLILAAAAAAAVVVILIPAALSAQEVLEFEDHFIDRTMRVDYFQTGDAQELIFSIDQIYQEGRWGGNPTRLIDDFNSGMYYVKVYDIATNRLLYARGFATIFGEYRTTDDAKQGIRGTFHESALIPYPKSPVRFVIEGRDRYNILKPIFVTTIDPADVNIIREKPDRETEIVEVMVNGDMHDKVDFVFIAEGYTAEEKEKFVRDVSRFTGVLFSVEPFKSCKDRFNIYGVFHPSSENGVDEPRRGIYRNSVVNSSFNALDLDRYLLVDDNKTLRDIASAVPYDVLAVIANMTRYGGGGIYNDYFICTTDNNRSEHVFMHELGHAFANLADEYFGAPVSYNEFFPPGIEPHEPNITALLDRENVKWKHLLTPGIPIPTPWGEDEIDSLQVETQKLSREMRAAVARLQEEGADQEEIRAARDRYQPRINELRAEAERVREHYQNLYRGKIGVFEGAGYSPEGLYRSEVHIGMYSNGSYGSVSEEAILRIIMHLSR